MGEPLKNQLEVSESWACIDGYPGYLVSNYGRIKSLKTKRGADCIFLKYSKDKDGYFKVCLCNKNIKRNFRVHQIVANAFVKNPSSLPVINHKDENKQNNNYLNLEWCTVRYNTLYNEGAARRSEKRKRPINQLMLDGTFLKLWDSRATIVAETGFCGGNITSACTGNRKTANGFKWEYAQALNANERMIADGKEHHADR